MSEPLRVEQCPATILQFPNLKSRLRVFTARETAANPPQRAPALFRGLVRQGDFMMVGAPRGAFKSWLMLDMALLIAAGEGSLFGVFDVAGPQRVLSLHGELDRRSVYERRLSMLGSSRVPDGLYDVFDPVKIDLSRERTYLQLGDGASITTERLAAEIDVKLEDAISEVRPGVLIIDPYASFNGGEENSNDDAEAIYQEIRRLIDRYDMTVIAVHHFSQSSGGGRDPEDSWRGASRLADAASVRVTLDPYYTTKAAKHQGLNRATARQFAWARFLVRRDETPADIPIRFDMETLRFMRWQNAPEDAAANNKRTITIEEISEAMGKERSFPSTKKAAAALRCSQPTAKSELERHVREGKLTTKDGKRNATEWHLPSRWDTVDRPEQPHSQPPNPALKETP